MGSVSQGRMTSLTVLLEPRWDLCLVMDHTSIMALMARLQAVAELGHLNLLAGRDGIHWGGGVLSLKLEGW